MVAMAKVLQLQVSWMCVCSLTGMLTQLRACESLLLLGSSVRVSKASLTRMDTALRMNEANRFMWMLFLIQWSFLRGKK